MFWRLFVIYYTFYLYRIDTVVAPLLKWHMRLMLFLLGLPFCWRPFVAHKQADAVRCKNALEALGPVFVKFGQVLSIRSDMLPAAYIAQLSLLQSAVEPVSTHAIVDVIQKALGASIAQLFADFADEPLAAASVAQVHRAKLYSGQQVVVKVIRPAIHTIVKQDIAWLKLLTWLLEVFWVDGKRLRLRDIVNDYEETIFGELNLTQEAANASVLRHNFTNSAIFYVPEIHWDYVSADTLVMEYVDGVPISDLKTMRAKKVNMQRLADIGTEIFYTQVLRDSFFHADMHPGNILVDLKDPENPRYLGIDFGIMGSLVDNDLYYLAHNLLAFFERDYRKIAVLHIESGWVNKNTNVIALETAVRTVCEPVFDRMLGEISVAKVLITLFAIARKFNMEVQPQLVLLQKTLLNVEALGRMIYPDLNLWKSSYQHIKKWIKKRTSLYALGKDMWTDRMHWFEHVPALPQKAIALLNAQLIEHKEQQAYKQQLISSNKRQKTYIAILCALLVASYATAAWFWVYG